MQRGFVYAALDARGQAAEFTQLAAVRCLALRLPVIVASVVFLCKFQSSKDKRTEVQLAASLRSFPNIIVTITLNFSLRCRTVTER